MTPVEDVAPAKPVHMAKFIGPGGAVSPLCAARPRALDLRRASWTNRVEVVTCPRCLAMLRKGVEP